MTGSLGGAVDASRDGLFGRLDVELGEYLAGRRIRFDLPLAPVGDEFQHAVWGMLREIPFGETVTYGELAVRLGDRNLARRVGGAVGRNPISILVPCHRVVGSRGSLTGYAGGLDRKRRLLELEGAAVVAQRRLFRRVRDRVVTSAGHDPAAPRQTGSSPRVLRHQRNSVRPEQRRPSLRPGTRSTT